MNQQNNYVQMWEQFGSQKAGILSNAKFQPTYRIGLTNYLRERYIFDYLPITKEDVVADIGCAAGRQAFIAAKKAKYVIGTDIADSFMEFARKQKEVQQIQNVDFVTTPLERLPFKDQEFNKIICSEVIEHVLDLNTSLNELNRVLDSHGMILITVPNLNADGTLWGRLLRSLGIRTFTPLTDFSPESLKNNGDSHVREFSVRSLTTKLKQAGFKPVRWTTVSMIDFNDRVIGLCLKIPPLKWLMIQIEHILSHLKLPYGRHIVILCIKCMDEISDTVDGHPSAV
ncbi:methyltransferase domain-containing protein [Candidatus Uhrbacteria bacterium]|nr:methyltransferase domain-containing protein [Candidatus Uhrbacteria bacterium]